MAHANIPAAISALRDFLGERVSTGDSILDQHSHDEAHTAPVRPDAVVFPNSTEEVSRILAICSQNGCPVIPYGIGSSLEGHVVPVHGGITVDTSGMNKVIEIHESDLDAVVEPGVTRTQLNDALRATGLMFTVDPGADATLGGMAATRASGTNTVRYGTMADNVLALEVVLPDGQIIETGSRARKSSTGYDLTRLFVGSEGTLGIITKLTVKLHGQPEHIAAATCAFPGIASAVDTVILAIQMGLPMARIELLDEVQMQGMNVYNCDLGLPEVPHLFLEFHGTEAGVAEQVAAFEEIAKDLGGQDFQWATRTEDRNRLWQARHNAYYAGKALRKGCEGVVTDCCVPISALADCIGRTKDLIAQSGMIAPLVGHVGDGNFHLLILIDPNDPEDAARAAELAAAVNDLALSFGGTVSGEHGIGLGKRKYLPKEHGPAYDLMATLKRAVDPGNIMNPGKLVTLE
ncbi:FAD-linked oxidase C-terminal domain-containing protein [Marivita sp. GX14005]|uniref:FAD-binding oxidoreductase n=1 Tax=Marivita sp. GX14005 TaxID=2942276 RepID=UPI002018916F|nr:FAD-linked oxidase C-terminal domain-containing protein [Marivita sp. GX14005]MCL3880852.1 FAD-binding protein [Marivita sp. GX14005]